MENPELKLATIYRITGYRLDANARSTWTYYDVPLVQTSPLSAMSEKQDAVSWGLGVTPNKPDQANNIDEMHKTGQMGIVWVMSGHLETTIQVGEMRRRAAGEGNFVHGSCLHHSYQKSIVPTTTLSLNLTPEVTDGYVFK